jgi:hypothetical protein
LPGFGSFLESAGIGIGGVLPIGTALVTEFAPRRNSCRFMARARETDPPAPVPRADRTARPALRLPADIANFFFANSAERSNS